jgi:uncharacterized membrane protein
VSVRLLGWLERLRSGYWFLPALMALGALALAGATVALDHSITLESAPILRTLGGVTGPAGARSLLSTVAGSLITVTGVVFSMTLVGLSLASQQFGPRLVGNFMRDRGNQLALGAFVGTFLYCLMVLRTVRTADTQLGIQAFVPHLSVAVAMALTLISLGVLIYFIHHAAESVQVSYVLARVGRGLTQQILSFPEAEDPAAGERDAGAAGEGESPPSPPELPEDFGREAITVRAARAGYVQAIDLTGLVNLARENDAVLRLHHPPGSFLMLDGPFADIYPPEAGEALTGRIEPYYVLGAVRTPQQDPYFLFDQLLEVALRALSPSMNDPFTAVTCIDRMAEALNLLARRRLPDSAMTDEAGVLRLVVPRPEVGELLEHLFGELRSNAAGDPMVARHLALSLRRMQASSSHEELQRAADREVRRLLESAVTRLSVSDYEALRLASRRVTAWIRLED